MANTRKIIHIDMDCFYAAVEMREDPSLRGKPIAVGGSQDKRGVLCTCNYEARQFGCRSAMSTSHALRLCPDLILIPVNMALYKAVSVEIREIFSDYTKLIEPLSLDEAYLDVTHCEQYNNNATDIAAAIRQDIFEQLQLTASAGIAPNKFLAKIASDWRKPNGQFAIKPHHIDDFIKGLPITKIFGVGKVTAKKMHDLNIETCLDLQQWSSTDLTKTFGKFGQQLYHYARGIDNREVQLSRQRKSVSVENTFAEDLPSLETCLAQIPTLLPELKKRLQGYDTHIKNVFVKLKFNDFQSTTAEQTHPQLSVDMFTKLLEKAWQRQQAPVRLIGLGVHFETGEHPQQSLLF
jgi:DNA polymerase-4